MNKTVETDIAIIGGGIAGLWLLNRLRQLGFHTILLESNTLGGEQTHKAQGIIHGGMKYALQGSITTSTQSIADMPSVWQSCLEGHGEINLKNVPILSPKQYLWSTGSLTSKLAGFFASLALKGTVQQLNRQDFPDIFQDTNFKGQVYVLEEMVLDVTSLIRELAKPHEEVIFKINPTQATQLHYDHQKLTSLEITTPNFEPIDIHAQKYIFTAGAGNELLSKAQRRPLHMVMVKTNFTYPLYAHCLGLGATPRMTITTHLTHDNQYVWYIGGQIAEEGVKRDKDSQIAATKQELQELFSWLDFSNAKFTSFFVDRAEPLQKEGNRPDSCYAKAIENTIIAWPTKLALAPKLANEIIQQLAIKPKTHDLQALNHWPRPTIAQPIWDQLL